MNKQKEEFYDWIENKRIMNGIKESKDPGKSHADYIIEKTKKMFTQTHTIEKKSDEELLDQMGKLYSPDEDGCKEWVRVNKKFGNMHMLKRLGGIARKYFGDEMVERIWKEKA